MRRIALLLALLAPLLVVAPAQAANVALFNDTTYVGNEESENLQAVLLSQGHTVFTFTDESPDGMRTALTGREVAGHPGSRRRHRPEHRAERLGAGDHPPVRGGRRRIRHQRPRGGLRGGRADQHAVQLRPDRGQRRQLRQDRQPGRCGPSSPNGPDALVGTTPLRASTSRPSGGANQRLPAPGHAHVAVLYRGLGSITYLGWDWNDSNPPSQVARTAAGRGS